MADWPTWLPANLEPFRDEKIPTYLGNVLRINNKLLHCSKNTSHYPSYEWSVKTLFDQFSKRVAIATKLGLTPLAIGGNWKNITCINNVKCGPSGSSYSIIEFAKFEKFGESFYIILENESFYAKEYECFCSV